MKKILFFIPAIFFCCICGFAQTGIITTIAGNGSYDATGLQTGYAQDIGLQYVRGIDVDSAGNVFFVSGNTIKKINTLGMVTTIAGSMVAGHTGDGGPATAALLNTPTMLKLDNHGNIYFIDNASFIYLEK